MHNFSPKYRECINRLVRRLARAHRNERGTISIITVFTLLLFTMLLMMLFNIARQFDDKMRMQNAADAATYSGGTVLARGMNAVAFSNHLEADVLALTAFLREARDRNAESYVPEILAAWSEVGPQFSGSAFPKFQPLGTAIPATVPLEQQFVTAWSDMAASAADAVLPVFEFILGTPENVNPSADDHLIPQFQRDVVSNVPQLAQDCTLELAMRHGLRQDELESLGTQLRSNPGYGRSDRGHQAGVLWRMSVEPVAYSGETDPQTRTLPVVDPDPYLGDYSMLPNGDAYLQHSRQRRYDLAHMYLNHWVRDVDPRRGLDFADEEARMSQFARLFWTAACAQLEKLLNQEYPNTNVPFILRNWNQPIDNDRLDGEYMYVGVCYRKHVDEFAPRLFQNPLDDQADAQTFAQATLFIPRPRLRCCPWIIPTYDEFDIGNVTGYVAHTDGWENDWDSFNQNWTAKLVPATAPALGDILASNPGGPAGGLRVSNLSGVSADEIRAVNTH